MSWMKLLGKFSRRDLIKQTFQKNYPVPDRSDYSPKKTKEEGILDIGWYSGKLTDNREFRAEYWCENGVSVVTLFMSSIDIENVSKKFFEDLLLKENLITFHSTKKYIGIGKFIDNSGHEMWSINVVIGDDEELFADTSFPLSPYS